MKEFINASLCTVFGNAANFGLKTSSLSRDALTISIVNSLTSIFGGFVVFSAIGYMSHLQNVPIRDLAVDGKKIIIVIVILKIFVMKCFY